MLIKSSFWITPKFLTWKVVLVAVTFKLLSELGSDSRQAKSFRLRLLFNMVVQFHLNGVTNVLLIPPACPSWGSLSPCTTLKGAGVFAWIGLKPIMSTQIFIYTNSLISTVSEGIMSKWIWYHFLLLGPGLPEAGQQRLGRQTSGGKGMRLIEPSAIVLYFRGCWSLVTVIEIIKWHYCSLTWRRAVLPQPNNCTKSQI